MFDTKGVVDTPCTFAQSYYGGHAGRLHVRGTTLLNPTPRTRGG